MFLMSLWERFKRFALRFTQPHKRSRLERYLVPLILILVIVVIKIFLRMLVGENTFHLLSLIIILSAWYGGFGPGILATVIVSILDTFFFLPSGQSFFTLYNLISTCFLIVGGIIISSISEAKQQADSQKDEFIGFASHELKNPLATILGYSQMLHKMTLKMTPKRVSNMGLSIEEQAKRATLLINELLDVTKIESGKLSYHDERFALYDLVKSVVADQKVINKSHKIVLKGKSQKKILADKYRIGQVLINLITNAIKYSPNAKKVVVVIKNKRREVIVSVQDFGKGIAEENTRKVFDPYFRENSVSQRKAQGLGLGLYISNEIVKRHNGRLWVKSTEGKGSTFFLALPIRK